MVFVQPEKSSIKVAPGTFGWSGAVGTHMFVNLEFGISATYMVSMGDLNGAASFISRQIEAIVFSELN
jgi:CubicO group peptidase (beta-lactamase class C family)